MNVEDDPLRIPPDEPSSEARPAALDSRAATDDLRAPETQEDSALGSNPNSSGADGLSGGMGVSSERTGPDGPDPRTRNPIEGTGSKGGAVTRTDGGLDTPHLPRTEHEIVGEE